MGDVVDAPMHCLTCMTTTLHRADYQGQMHCMPCLARAAMPPMQPMQPRPQQVIYQQRDGAMMTVIKIAAFILALLFLASFVTCASICGGTAAVINSAGSSSGK